MREGLAETYTQRISVTPDGLAYKRHGATRSMSFFDGFRGYILLEAQRQPHLLPAPRPAVMIRMRQRARPAWRGRRLRGPSPGVAGDA